MAAAALVGREDVVGGLGGSAHGGADAVTGGAISRVPGTWRWRDRPRRQVAVLADELEAGRQMVEVQARRRGEGLRQQPEEEQHGERAHTQGRRCLVTASCGRSVQTLMFPLMHAS